MNLLVFAHRGEAKAFINELSFKPFHNQLKIDLYVNENCYLLITGEGHSNASENLSLTVGLLNEKLENIYNFGVCGSFDTKISKGEILRVRTIYRESNGKIEFKSYTTAFDNPQYDLITTDERKLNQYSSDLLDTYAPLVDRESWSLASVCKRVKIPFYAVKIVSDHIGKDVNVCEFVKENSLLWSESLLNWYQSHQASSLPSVQFDHEEEINSFIDNIKENFHFTLAMKRSLKSLVEIAKRQDIDILNTLKEHSLDKLISLEQKPKDKAKLLIDLAWETLHPLEKKIKDQLNQIELSHSHFGLNLKFPPTLDASHFSIHANISSKEQLYEIIKELKKIDFDKINDIELGKKL